MSRKTKKRKKPEEEHAHLCIRVDSYEASVRASINHDAYAPQYAWSLDEDEPVYEFTSQATITGVSTSPPERAGDIYELTLSGVDASSYRLNLKLKDIQARDAGGSLQYRTYRGKEVPVYVPPSGLGMIEKVRGERRWTAWLFVAPRFVNDALVLLGQRQELFLALHERKAGRARWVQDLALQTTDPAEE